MSLEDHPSVQRKKTILMIDYSFPPIGGAGAQRTLGYVTHISEFGWSPIVLTVASGYGSYYDPSLLSEIPPHVTVVRARSIEPARFARNSLYKSRNGKKQSPSQSYSPVLRSPDSWLRTLDRWVGFPDRRIGWLPFAVARSIALRLDRRVDLIYSTSTAITSHLIAFILKMLWKKPWVADFQDPWSQSPITVFPSRMHGLLADRLEHRILRAADHVIVTTHPIRDMLLEKYPDIAEGKLTVIPMGFEPDRMIWSRSLGRERFTVTHLGTLYGTRSARPFLQALGECLSAHPEVRKQVEVLFFGRLDAKNLHEAEAVVKDYDLEEIVQLHDPVAYEEGLRILGGSDVLLLVEDTGPCARWRLPTKVFEYLGMQKPILAVVPEGAAAQLLRETGGAVLVAPDDVRGIARVFWTLFLAWESGRLHFSGNEDMIRTFAWSERTRAFVSTIEQVWKRLSPA